MSAEIVAQEVTRALTGAGYAVESAPNNLDGDPCVLVTDPRSRSSAHCLAVFWPPTRAWPLAVYRGDELYDMCDSVSEFLAIVGRCLADRF
jgi:hypothetical protein